MSALDAEVDLVDEVGIEALVDAIFSGGAFVYDEIEELVDLGVGEAEIIFIGLTFPEVG